MQQSDFWKIWAIGLLPDIGLAWAYMKLSDGDTASFWWCLLALWVIGTFFLIKQVLTGTLIFRLYGKERIATLLAQGMERLQFPAPEADEDFETYMCRLVSSEELPINLRLEAQATLSSFRATQEQGLFVALRMAAAHNLAVKKYGGAY
ncbi:hypothetical protein [Polaromonas sp. AET17H-212]|uniref:hypothetical protein n=1 Tax=Polaromonas sp. AET17H-212 TaxID=1977061 RepID=UPI000BBC2505|nr:hypothetical protein [Polaromonas sp. AET17H-212]